MVLSSEFLSVFDALCSDPNISLDEFGNLQRDIYLKDVKSINNRLQGYIDDGCETIDGKVSLIKNIIITSPTQVGKTTYIIENCKKNENKPYLFILTCDNSKAQMAQLKDRLKRDGGIEALDLKQATKSRVQHQLCLGRAVFLVMLNNGSQISKLDSLVNSLRLLTRPKKYIVFHDEADTINKDDSGCNIDDLSVAISHRGWVSFFHGLSTRCEDVKRFWVTATPENCSTISNIVGRDIVVLPKPSDYVPINRNIDWNGELDEKVEFEIERIREAKSNEVILYCVDRKKENHNKLALEISQKYNCVSFSYNGDGFKIYKRGAPLNLKLSSSVGIPTVLKKLKGSDPIVVVGYTLMDRGISFVAEKVDGDKFPLTATIMFYDGGVSRHLVGLAQIFGRICGNSRPDITRRVVYCKSSVFSDYFFYIKNQNTIYKRLCEFEELTMMENLSDSDESVKIVRDLDRPNLKIVNGEYKRSSYSSTSSESDSGSSYDEDKMHKLVDSWKMDVNRTSVARVFRKMISNGGKLETDKVIEIVGINGLYNITSENLEHGYSLVFRKERDYHYIRNEVLEYLG